MSRGTFRDLADLQAYRDANKDWFVNLFRSRCFWHEQTVDVIDGFDCTSDIAVELREFKRIVAAELDKRFIYFIASRLESEILVPASAKLLICNA